MILRTALTQADHSDWFERIVLRALPFNSKHNLLWQAQARNPQWMLRSVQHDRCGVMANRAFDHKGHKVFLRFKRRTFVPPFLFRGFWPPPSSYRHAARHIRWSVVHLYKLPERLRAMWVCSQTTSGHSKAALRHTLPHLRFSLRWTRRYKTRAYRPNTVIR